MRLNKQKRLSKWPVPLLFILIGGSIFLLVGGFVLRHYINAAQTQDILPANTSSSVSYNALSIQAHAITPTAGHSHDKTSGKPTKQPSLSSTPGVSSTTPSGSIGNNNITLPPGSALPSDSACASHVNYSAFEPRPDNYAADHRVPSAAQIANLHPWNPLIGMDDKSDSLRRRVTGNFMGTTDEILQWAACKWGIDVNIIRAEAVTESTWHQSQLGDYTTNKVSARRGHGMEAVATRAMVSSR